MAVFFDTPLPPVAAAIVRRHLPCGKAGELASLPSCRTSCHLFMLCSFHGSGRSLLGTVSTTKYPWVARVALRRPGFALPLATQGYFVVDETCSREELREP